MNKLKKAFEVYFSVKGWQTPVNLSEHLPWCLICIALHKSFSEWQKEILISIWFKQNHFSYSLEKNLWLKMLSEFIFEIKIWSLEIQCFVLWFKGYKISLNSLFMAQQGKYVMRTNCSGSVVGLTGWFFPFLPPLHFCLLQFKWVKHFEMFSRLTKQNVFILICFSPQLI